MRKQSLKWCYQRGRRAVKLVNIEPFVILFIHSMLLNKASRSLGRPHETFSPAPIPWLPLQKRTDRTKIAFVPQEVSLLSPLRPETNSVGKSIHRLGMTTNE